MRSLFLVACLLVAGPALAQPALAQEASQRELNALTGAPEGTRCFQSMALAQEMAKHYIASGLCPQDLSAMDPGDFMSALQASNVIDRDFTSSSCQTQMKLMFRAGREWIAQNPRSNCAETAEEMWERPVFKNYVRRR